MSLRPSSWKDFVQVSDLQSIFECRLGESFEAMLTFTSGTPPAPQPLANWTFNVFYSDATAVVDESATNVLNSITGFTLLSSTPQTNPNLVVTNVSSAAGTAILVIPAAVLSMPALSAPIDSTTTLVKLFQITASFPGIVSGSTQVRKVALAAIVRWAQ